jgi:hypothetical protein
MLRQLQKERLREKQKKDLMIRKIVATCAINMGICCISGRRIMQQEAVRAEPSVGTQIAWSAMTKAAVARLRRDV